jgi:hypothetical protein
MARSRRTVFHTPAPARTIKPLEHLERVQPVYFFTPDLEREINKLDGVTSCRVLSTGAEIDEIHVVAPPERIPKKVVRDIESLLLVRFGIRIDHRKISVVQLNQAQGQPPTPVRPRITKVEARGGEAGAEVCVEVWLNGAVVVGEGRAQEGESDLHASSRAVIDAIEKLLKRQGSLALQSIVVVPASASEIVLVVLRWTLGAEEEVLVGASVSRGERVTDAARATFDAMNRKLVRAHPPHREP